MFILRRVLKDRSEVNTSLGEYYTLQLKEKNQSAFDEVIKMWSEEDLENVYGVVIYDDGSKIMPLYQGSAYYIMTSDGRTFDNVSLK